MALIFLNRYLDIAEAIEDGLTHIELRPIQGASMPNRIPLLRKQSISTRLKDEVRDWVIAASLDPSISQQLTQRLCEACGLDTFEANLACHHCGANSEPCAISGYPLIKAEALALTHGGVKVVVRRQDWHQYVQHFSSCPVTGIDLKPHN